MVEPPRPVLGGHLDSLSNTLESFRDLLEFGQVIPHLLGDPFSDCSLRLGKLALSVQDLTTLQEEVPFIVVWWFFTSELDLDAHLHGQEKLMSLEQ